MAAPATALISLVLTFIVFSRWFQQIRATITPSRTGAFCASTLIGAEKEILRNVFHFDQILGDEIIGPVNKPIFYIYFNKLRQYFQN
jgi:hypothetical protein